MITKVLIAEDHESANISVQKTLEELNITQIDYTYYCDDAVQKIQIAHQKNEPYDLLISDLYFEEDERIQRISEGTDLIVAARQVQPDLKVLVFSAEDKPAVIESLFNNQDIDGYVRKARNDAKELKMAIEFIANNQRYLPRHLVKQFKQKNTHEFTEFDIIIISLMARGIRQKDIPAHLKEKQIQPSGLSSIEKRLNRIKEALDFSNNEQLVAYCKDMGIV
ncbi:response regulator [Dinghuibacter silviterrae]|uniref:DNA-binding NarL/FixJ family response regulator n=1 Tax=Dinghuibacter silviterrae TaxID=1539049 RepID=A0A4R8DQF5_9BACT|nr:response regulator [Dinghuibacter silviterrae]TDX00380.1 DNA-binding NarL/FixJ family response regulator [Dinghuibacter silviterrae]